VTKLFVVIFLKFGIEVLSRNSALKLKFRENRISASHTQFKPVLSILLGEIAEIRYSFMQVGTVSAILYPSSLNKTSPYFVHASSSLDNFFDKAIEWPRVT
jgi:hypothetical protein